MHIDQWKRYGFVSSSLVRDFDALFPLKKDETTMASLHNMLRNPKCDFLLVHLKYNYCVIWIFQRASYHKYHVEKLADPGTHYNWLAYHCLLRRKFRSWTVRYVLVVLSRWNNRGYFIYRLHIKSSSCLSSISVGLAYWSWKVIKPTIS